MTTLPPNIDGRLGADVTVIDNAGHLVEGRLIAYAPEPSAILELSDGRRVSYPVRMVQQRPLRERVADLLSEFHDSEVTEGGCDFRAEIHGEPHEVVDKIIALVQGDDGPKEGEVATCAHCGIDGEYLKSEWVHHGSESRLGIAHRFTVA